MPNLINYNLATQSFEFRFDYSFEQKEFVKRELHGFYHAEVAPAYWNLREERADINNLFAYIDHFKPALTPTASTRLDQLSGVAANLELANDASVELSLADDADLSEYDLSGFGVEPYRFQRSSILYGMLKQKSINADQMGLGKTVSSLAIAHLSGAADKCFVVVCPASVKLNWAREAKRAMPHLNIEVWGGKVSDRRIQAKSGQLTLGASFAPNCVIINYDNLKKQLDRLKMLNPAMVIFDEGHYLKSGKAQRTQAAHALADGVDFINILTGTPILARPEELISLLDMIGWLDYFGGYWTFVKRYCNAHKKTIWVKRKGGGHAFQKQIWDTSGAANLEELNLKLRQFCMVRHLKEDVLKDLPAKQRVQVSLPLTNRSEYNSAATNLISYLKSSAAANKAFLTEIAYLPDRDRKAAIADRQQKAAEGAENAEALVMLETLKHLSAEGKLEGSIQWVSDFLESGERLVLFATHVNIQHALYNAFKTRATHIMAQDTPEERQAAIQRFQSDPECRLMVCSLIAGGQGVDGMQNVCSNVAFHEMGDTPAHHLQAEDRCHRIGQASSVTCYYMVAEDTIEEKLQTMLAAKQAVCESVLDGASEQREGSIFNELIKLMTYPEEEDVLIPEPLCPGCGQPETLCVCE